MLIFAYYFFPHKNIGSEKKKRCYTEIKDSKIGFKINLGDWLKFKNKAPICLMYASGETE